MIKQWIETLLNWFKLAETALKASLNFIMNKIWILFFPLISLVKGIFDFFRTIVQKVMSAFDAIDFNLFSKFDGSTASLGDPLKLANSIVPLDELFSLAMFVFLFWQACLLVRTLKGIKQTVAM